MAYDSTTAELLRENTRLKAEIEAIAPDAERYRWMAPRMLAADFDYMDSGTQVLVFEMPDGFQASADCDSTIDAAMAADAAVGAA